MNYNTNQNESNICPFCGVMLSSNYDFNNHIRLCPLNPDTNQKSYSNPNFNSNQNESNICPFCGVMLSSNYDFNNHIRLCPLNPNTNQKSYSNPNFNPISNFNPNRPPMNQYYVPKDFNSCPYCNISFKSQIDLMNHMNLCPYNPIRSVIPIKKKEESSFGLIFVTVVLTVMIIALILSI